MENFMYWLWIVLAIVLIVAEIILPGMVVVFVGFGAVTVAVLMHFNYLDDIIYQILTFFGSTLIYCLTLRMAFIHFYPTDTKKQNTDEDKDIFGQVAKVIETIPETGIGRINHSGSTWQAISKKGEIILEGERVTIVGRENITWIVKK